MKTKKAIRFLAKDGTGERLRKLSEELIELADAIKDGGTGKNSKETERAFKHVIEEAADVSVCIEAFVEATEQSEAFKNFRIFKISREVARRYLEDPAWCATTPKKEAV